MTLLEFFNLSNIHCIIAIFISIANAILMVLVARKFFQILQISGYKIRGYNSWLKDTKAKYISRIAMLSFLSLFCVLVTNFLFDVYHSEAIYSYFGLIFYIYFTIVFFVNVNKIPQKTPLVQTRRMSRLTTLMFILSYIITFVLIWFATVYTPFLRFGIIVFTPLLTPLLVPLVHFALIPLEKMIRNHYIKKAKKILKNYPNLIKIGITGSYGKTSTKYILNKILSEKFNVCMTPHSFNTPMGLTKVVRKYLKPENQILIAEMGAKEPGDIKFLCDFIHPTHAILSGVGTQHYETFGSADAIAKTKYELVESLNENAIAVFNTQSDECKKLFEKCPLKNKVGLDENSLVTAKNIKLSPFGTEFELSFDKKTIHCHTALLGSHNVTNILLASNMAVSLGVSLEQIASALEDLEPISHRLEIIKNGNLTVIDDAYSANVEGVKSAVEVLSLFEGHTKICVTPGIVELGEREFSENVELGKLLGRTCDFVVIVNKVNEEALKKGLSEVDFLSEKILSADTLDLAKNKLGEITPADEKIVVLFVNDLPDNYT